MIMPEDDRNAVHYCEIYSQTSCYLKQSNIQYADIEILMEVDKKYFQSAILPNFFKYVCII